MDELERQQALAAFLRTRRTRLQPADVGLPARSRRRTPGLRREEVAELANIGVSWYTLLEQGHDVHPSRHVLESLAQALRLTTAEEQHLLRLSGLELPATMMVEEEQVTPALQRVVDALDPHPAFVIGRRWDVLTWNRTADLIFQFHEPCPPHSRNAVWRFCVRPPEKGPRLYGVGSMMQPSLPRRRREVRSTGSSRSRWVERRMRAVLMMGNCTCCSWLEKLSAIRRR